MENVTFTRKQLYDLVWAESLPSLSKKLAVPYDDLRKVCKQMRIPLPKPGHWQKLKAGKKVSADPLPELDKDQQEMILSIQPRKEKKKENLQILVDILKREIEKECSQLLIVPSSLTNPDELIIAAKNLLENERPETDSNFRGLIYCRTSELNVRVSPNNLSRALRFMDTFIKLLRVRGHEIIMVHGKVCIAIENETMKMSLFEKMKKVLVTGKNNWREAECSPTGILALKIRISHRDTEWNDGKSLIEKQLSKILATLEIKGKDLKKEQLERDERAKIHEEKERVHVKFQERRKKEISDFKNLFRVASQWSQAITLRNYIDAVEANAISKNSVSDELKNWLEWARKKIDWYDPLITAKDELMEGVDRETITFEG